MADMYHQSAMTPYRSFPLQRKGFVAGSTPGPGPSRKHFCCEDNSWRLQGASSRLENSDFDRSASQRTVMVSGGGGPVALLSRFEPLRSQKLTVAGD